jgi:predicted O-linked N-acetylglucosamine transferase (SPINDLY family)
VAIYEQVIALAPHEPAAYDEAAKVQLTAARFDEAWAIYARGVRALPGTSQPFVQWVNAAIKAGEVDQAVPAARAGVAACPDDPATLLQLCVALAFADNPDPAEHTALHRRLGELTAARSPRPAPAFPNTRDLNRRLRVAFMSGDFRFHACAFFMAGPLTALDRARIEPFCYVLNAPDQLTPNFAQLAKFRDLSKATDDQIVAQARADGIDILLDCFGWSAGHRMAALCPRIAPVQIDYLGYSNTTGLPTMDYRAGVVQCCG